MTGGTAELDGEGPGMSKVGPGRRPKGTGFRKGGKRQSRRQAQEGTPGRLDFRFRCGHRQDIDDRAGRKSREVTIEEALWYKTYQNAIAGDRSARREVLKMIDKRDKYLAAHQQTRGHLGAVS